MTSLHASSTRRIAGLLAAAALAATLAACQDASLSDNRHLKPIPAKTIALMEEKGMRKQDPILVRIFKEESEFEIWKKRPDGRYALLKTYPICRWSGSLGPKIREGDKQAPEGFYTVTPAQMNPRSAYHLSFDLGFPNAFDRVHGRTGRYLMVHGDCLSAGCYALTDEQVAEVYAIAREAFAGGQRAFQVQAMPFRMTAKNMARRRDNKNMAFWKNLKEGYDHFEVTRREPQVAVCDRHYVFDATPKDGARFDPSAACPSFEVAPAIALAVSAKKRADEQLFASLVADGLKPDLAYVPQNGRLRRTLQEPIRTAEVDPAPLPAAARAPQRTAMAFAGTAGGAATPVAATGAVPMPVPSPHARPQASGSGVGTMLSWIGLGPSRPQPVAEPASPVATASLRPAGTRPAVAPAPASQPIGSRTIGASMAPRPAPAPRAAAPAESVPFYKRWLGLGSSTRS